MVWLCVAIYGLGVPLGTLLYEKWATGADKDSGVVLVACCFLWPFFAAGIWWGILATLALDARWWAGWWLNRLRGRKK